MSYWLEMYYITIATQIMLLLFFVSKNNFLITNNDRVIYNSWHSILHLFFSIKITDRLINNT